MVIPRAQILGHRHTAVATPRAQTLGHRYTAMAIPRTRTLGQRHTARYGNHIRPPYYVQAYCQICPSHNALSEKTVRRSANHSVYTRLSIYVVDLFSPSSEQMQWKSHNYSVFGVRVTLGIQNAMFMCHTVICGLPVSTMLFHIISRTVQFSKKKFIEHDLYFDFLYKFV